MSEISEELMSAIGNMKEHNRAMLVHLGRYYKTGAWHGEPIAGGQRMFNWVLKKGGDAALGIHRMV
jgi:hypothetical protein